MRIIIITKVILLCKMSSLSVEKLSIHITLKEKVALRRKNKFEALYQQYLQKREEERDEEDLKVLLNRRREAVFEMCTRSYEEERKKAEEEIAQVRNRFFIVVSGYHCMIPLQEKEKILNVSL